MGKRFGKTMHTEEDLKEAFWRLYAENPMEKITVGEVCRLAGYNRSTFYLHFQDLYALLQAIEDSLLDGMTRCVEGCMKRLRREPGKLGCIAACGEVVCYYERNKAYISVLLGDRGDPAFARRLKDNLKPLWREYVVSADCPLSDDEVDLLLEYALTGTLYMISRWLADPGTMTASQLAHLVYDFSMVDVRARSEARQ